MIRFLDLQLVNAAHTDAFKAKCAEFLASGRYIMSSNLDEFEKNFATFCGADYSIGVGNGLDALVLILEAYKHLGKLNNGDEVIVPANTFIATVLAISKAGLTPVLVEPNPVTFNLSAKNVKQAITSHTKAIMAVHLYGQIAEITELKALANQHNILLIEDAAQAQGALIDGKRAGNWGHAAAFSFYPGKNLGAIGDGGAITTSDKELEKTLRQYRNYGSEEKYIHSLKGVNSRLDELQAAFLGLKLNKLDEDNEQRRQIAEHYQQGITNTLISKPQHPVNGLSHVWHLYVIRCKQRDRLKTYLYQKGIETLIHYPIPPHKQGAYKELNNLTYPLTEEIHTEVLSLPIYPGLTEAEQLQIIAALNEFE